MGAERPLDEQPHRCRGGPSLHSLRRVRAHSYVLGPLVPSDTVRRDQNVGGLAGARAATGHGAGAGAAALRLGRGSPLEVYVGVGVASGWSQHRVSAGVATSATGPTQAAQAAHNAGLCP
jgi:hypothetical protein